MKICNQCGIEKPLGEFYLRKTGTPRANCKSCFINYVASNYTKNSQSPEWVEARNARHRELYNRHDTYYSNKVLRAQRTRNWALIREFGIDINDYSNLLLQQGGVCAICKTPPEIGKNLHVDHDHETKVIRGLLCGNCNRALGLFKESVETIDRAADYLEGVIPPS